MLSRSVHSRNRLKVRVSCSAFSLILRMAKLSGDEPRLAGPKVVRNQCKATACHGLAFQARTPAAERIQLNTISRRLSGGCSITRAMFQIVE